MGGLVGLSVVVGAVVVLGEDFDDFSVIGCVVLNQVVDTPVVDGCVLTLAVLVILLAMVVVVVVTMVVGVDD